MLRPASRSWLILILASLALAGCGPRPTPVLPRTSKGRTISRSGESLAALVKDARAGDRIVLKAGTYEAGVTLPQGVSLEGLSPTQTILDAKGAAVGLTIEGGSNVEVAGLSIRDARQTNLLIRGASEVTVRKVITSGGITGINLEGVTRGRVENSVASGNRYGIVASGGKSVSIVNCSLVANESLGLSLPSGSKTVAFNNLIVDGSVGVYLGEEARDARLDHNLYYTQFVGKAAGQVGRKSIGDWHSLTGQDGRSVRLPIAFSDPHDFQSSWTVPWDLDWPVTAEWGTAEFAGIKAPEFDMHGQPRNGPFGVGAIENRRNEKPLSDGSFSIQADEGLKSAGVFTTDGRLIAYLFHNLPLHKGEYTYWLPSRDFQNRPISSGSYEVRVVESALKWDYLGPIGDNGARSPASATASVNPIRSAFDDSGVLVLQQGWSEDGANLRGYDSATGRLRWAFDGRSEMLGLAVGQDGAAYSLRPSGTQGQITRLDPKTGKVAPIQGWPGGQVLIEGASKASGFAELKGRLFVADAASNKVRFGSVERPAFDGGFDLPSPKGLASERSREILWAISGSPPDESVVGLAPDGLKICNFKFPDRPAALAAREGRLAVADRLTGQVHIYDTTNLDTIKFVRTIGLGDGPAGPIVPDRFGFRTTRISFTAPNRGLGLMILEGSEVGLALGPMGELAITEPHRLVVFDGAGKVLWSTFGVFGNETKPSHSDPRRVYDTDGRLSFRLDEAQGTWQPESSRILMSQGEFLGDFSWYGQAFEVVLTKNASPASRDVTVYRLPIPKAQANRSAPNDWTYGPVSATMLDPKSGQYLLIPRSNGDAEIDTYERLDAIKTDSVASDLFARDTTLLPGGSLLTPGGGSAPLATIVSPSGLEHVEWPIYNPDDRRVIPRLKDGLISPYTLQPEPNADVTAASLTDDGGIIANVRLKSSPGGVGLFHNAGTDLIRFDAKGRPKWLHPLERHQGVEGLSTVGPVTITGVGVTSEILAFNADGLGLGSFGPTADVHYEGYFLDHPGAVRAYRGADGRTYALLADNYSGRHHWWRLHGVEAIVSTRWPSTIDTSKATELATRTAPKPRTLDRPSTPVVRIPRLPKELTIDGDLAKWREAGITPQIIVTPETSTGAIQDPRDMSALVRLAYRGNDLYAQFLQFDDKVTFHQPVARHYQHDGVELILNGFGKGFKFDATNTSDAGSIVLRSRFYDQKLEARLDPTQTPRSIRVLEDARDVPERKLIESVYGVDLSKCRVIVTEFKLPIDPTTYQGSTDSLFAMKPGQTFRLGLLINDNDEPGTDIQHYLVWPATYSNFGPVEDGALAVLE